MKTKVDPAKIKCLDCGHIGYMKEEDSCYSCNEKYNPMDSIVCPLCGEEEYDSHCEKCESINILYYSEWLTLPKKVGI